MWKVVKAKIQVDGTYDLRLSTPRFKVQIPKKGLGLVGRRTIPRDWDGLGEGQIPKVGLTPGLVGKRTDSK